MAVLGRARRHALDAGARAVREREGVRVEPPLRRAADRDPYKNEYNAVFGAKYPFPDLSGFALPDGKPGDAAYDALAPADRDAVTRVYVNVGKAIAAFERTLRVKPNALDRYAGGDTTALLGDQSTALDQFFKVGCVQCHWGPRLTDDAFHNLRFPTGRQDGAADQGRAAVLLGLATSEFVADVEVERCAGGREAACVLTSAPPSMVGAFKTPTLRGVSTSAPYGHGGTLRHARRRLEALWNARAGGGARRWPRAPSRTGPRTSTSTCRGICRDSSTCSRPSRAPEPRSRAQKRSVSSTRAPLNAGKTRQMPLTQRRPPRF